MTTSSITTRFRSLAVGLVLGVPLMAIASCGGAEPAADSSAEPTETEETSNAPDADTDTLEFALILSGSSTDQSWDQAAYEAAQALEADGIPIAVSEAVDPADVAAVLRQYAEQGYDLIVAHSFSYQDAVFQVSEEFPDVNFAWAGGLDRTSGNVADYDQPFYEGAYLVGIAAAQLSDTGKLGALYGFDIPVCHAMGEAMLAGAQTEIPEATLTSAAVGDWYDVAKAREAALAQAETGVDFWIGCGQGPTLGQIEAAKEVEGYATGYVGDMSSFGPEVVAVNLIWNMEPLFNAMIEDTQAETFADQYYRLAIADDVIQVVVTPAFEEAVGAEGLAAIEAARDQIAAGELDVPFVPQ